MTRSRAARSVSPIRTRAAGPSPSLDSRAARKAVYKPKNVGAERAFYDVVAFVSARADVPPLRPLRVVERDGYGWCEFVQHAPCADAAAAERYFERAGVLLAIVYVLEGVDCHRGEP